jgi:hypothetical protein
MITGIGMKDLVTPHLYPGNLGCLSSQVGPPLEVARSSKGDGAAPTPRVSSRARGERLLKLDGVLKALDKEADGLVKGIKETMEHTGETEVIAPNGRVVVKVTTPSSIDPSSIPRGVVAAATVQVTSHALWASRSLMRRASRRRLALPCQPWPCC